MTIDVRVWEANEWHKRHRWLEAEIDRLTMESRCCLVQERRLRDEVRREVEARAVQDQADEAWASDVREFKRAVRRRAS